VKRGWLLRHGDVLASAEVATGFFERSRGLLGRRDFDGAMLLAPARSVHSFGMAFPLDVAFLDKKMVVLDVVGLAPWRLTMPRRRGHWVLEAPSGSFERWGLGPGDVVEFREMP